MFAFACSGVMEWLDAQFLESVYKSVSKIRVNQVVFVQIPNELEISALLYQLLTIAATVVIFHGPDVFACLGTTILQMPTHMAYMYIYRY